MVEIMTSLKNHLLLRPPREGVEGFYKLLESWIRGEAVRLVLVLLDL